MTNLRFDQKKLDLLCEENGIVFLAVFGSVARGEDRADSDVDLLARFDEPKSLFELVDLQDMLSSVLGGRETDLVTDAFLSPFMKEKVKKDMRVIYNA